MHELVKSALPSERAVLKEIQVKGKISELLFLLLNNPDAPPDNEEIMQIMQISEEHLNKLSSQLLAKCYQALAPDGGIQLLSLLSIRSGWYNHFYKELKRQIRQDYPEWNSDQKKTYLLNVLTLMKENIPLAYSDEKVFAEIAGLYKELFRKTPLYPEADCLMECKMMLLNITRKFAQAKIKDQAKKTEAELDKRLRLPASPSKALLFDYYWTYIYFYHAIEDFSRSLALIEKAIGHIEKIYPEETDNYVFKLKLKQAEQFYFISRFEESYQRFLQLFSSPPAGGIPERGYYATKFFQVCLITSHFEDAYTYTLQSMVDTGYSSHDKISLRDCISFIKYYLLTGNYEAAFSYLLTGFERNPKAKYVQYEIELRNLQTALHYLTGDIETAMDQAERNLKFLRSHGYLVKTSYFPVYYTLIKDIYQFHFSGKPLGKKQQELLQRYHEGSYAQYGIILDLLMKYKPKSLK